MPLKQIRRKITPQSRIQSEALALRLEKFLAEASHLFEGSHEHQTSKNNTPKPDEAKSRNKIISNDKNEIPRESEENFRTAVPIVERMAVYLRKARPWLHQACEAHARLDVRFTSQPLAVSKLAAILTALREPLLSATQNGVFINVWEIAQLKRKEIRNAAVLGWFLNPHGSHGLNGKLLGSVLSIAGERMTPPWFPPKTLSPYSVRIEDYSLGGNDDRVDIAIDGPDLVAVIEVKIDASEGREQLRRYAALAARKAEMQGRLRSVVIYLSNEPPEILPDGTVQLTWRDIANIFRETSTETMGGSLAQQFGRHIRAFIK